MNLDRLIDQTFPTLPPSTSSTHHYSTSTSTNPKDRLGTRFSSNYHGRMRERECSGSTDSCRVEERELGRSIGLVDSDRATAEAPISRGQFYIPCYAERARELTLL